jgi:hypothetical protein
MPFSTMSRVPASRRTRILLVLMVVLAVGLAVALLRGGKPAPKAATTTAGVVHRHDVARAN